MPARHVWRRHRDDEALFRLVTSGLKETRLLPPLVQLLLHLSGRVLLLHLYRGVDWSWACNLLHRRITTGATSSAHHRRDLAAGPERLMVATAGAVQLAAALAAIAHGEQRDWSTACVSACRVHVAAPNGKSLGSAARSADGRWKEGRAGASRCAHQDAQCAHHAALRTAHHLQGAIAMTSSPTSLCWRKVGTFPDIKNSVPTGVLVFKCF